MIENIIIEKKINEIYASSYSKDFSSKFFYKSILHHVISLEVYKNNNSSGISFEKICMNIPKSIGSRSSIQSLLNEGLERGIFFKKQSKKDKRIKNYYLEIIYFNFINEWIDRERSYFKTINIS